jgi:hypothetical protein
MSVPEYIQPISAGDMALRVGVQYQVITSVSDDSHVLHPVGENIRYEGFSRPKMFPGDRLHFGAVHDADRKMVFSLKWRSEEQEISMAQFSTHIRRATVSLDEVFEHMRDQGLNLFDHYAKGLGFAPEQGCDTILKNIDSAIANVACAAGRSGGEVFEKAEVDLRQLYAEFDAAITSSLQGKVCEPIE